MVDMKFGECYLSKYIGFQRDLKRGFQIVTLFVSASGILGWKYFEEFAWIAFALIAIMQLILLIENQLIRSDKEIEEIAELRMMYTRYFHQLEKLWTNLYRSKCDEDEALDRFFQLRETDWEKIEKLDCKLTIKKFEFLMNSTDTDTNQYISKYHTYE